MAAVTRHPAGKRPLADRFGLALTASFADVLADPRIDAIVLATPHSQHCDRNHRGRKSRQALFCEKPFTLTRADAEAAIAACRAAGVTLHVGFNRRYAPAYVDMTRRIAAGEIGRLRHIEGQFSGPPSYQIDPDNWRSNQAESPGGSMTARGVHVVDSMVNIAGCVETVFAFSNRLQLTIDVDDTTSCLLRFAGGVTGFSARCMRQLRSTASTRSDRKARWKCAEKPSCWSPIWPATLQRIGYAVVDKERAELEAFAEAVASRTAFVIAPERIVNTVAVTEAVAASSRSGQDRDDRLINRPARSARRTRPTKRAWRRRSRRASARYARSLARMLGVEALMPPITVPAWSRMAAPMQITPGRYSSRSRRSRRDGRRAALRGRPAVR